MLSHTMPGLVMILAVEIEKNAELQQPHKNPSTRFWYIQEPSQIRYIDQCNMVITDDMTK